MNELTISGPLESVDENDRDLDVRELTCHRSHGRTHACGQRRRGIPRTTAYLGWFRAFVVGGVSECR